MPFGEHWEWRGFGQTNGAFRTWFNALPLLYPPSEKPLQDDYLWTPGCIHNVKLRYDALKFKRFIARRDHFERWREDEGDFLLFPLDARHLRELEKLLATRLSAIPSGPVDRQTFLAILDRARPPVQRITVIKRRRLALWAPQGSESPPVVLEWTQILSPEAIETVALEHEDIDVLQLAHTRLTQHLTQMAAMNYLQAIARWQQTSAR